MCVLKGVVKKYKIQDPVLGCSPCQDGLCRAGDFHHPSFLPGLCRRKGSGILHFPSQGLAMSVVKKIELYQALF